ncbi:hypothetical protein L1887_38207 [Cichorium endivia]|nr:hypothetical protein L1887_38207 [Cichorium endivia]
MDDIGGGQGSGITLLSDGHKGLLEAVKERAPNAEHRLCTRHILANFHKKFKGEQYINPFWKAVNATRQPTFEAAMKEIKALDNRAYDYLMERDPTCWSKAFFKEGMNCDAVENGVSESFNAAIIDAREKPIITMLEDIRVYVMERLYNQKVKGMGWDLAICPAIRKQLKLLKTLHRFWQTHVSGYQEFEVIQGTERYCVDLRKRECGCRIWQLTGIPCVHAMSAIASLNLDAEQYVADCYKTETFLKAYAFNIHPLNDSSLWPQNPELDPPLPPRRRRLPGRPATKRRRDKAERELSGKTKHTVSRLGSQKCSICKQTGHNKAKCSSKAGNQDPTNPQQTADATQDQDPINPQQTADKVLIDDVPIDDVPVDEVPIESTPAPKRIAKIGLKKMVIPKDGSGCSQDEAVALD